MLLRTKFRYLFGGLMVVGLLWGGLAVGASETFTIQPLDKYGSPCTQDVSVQPTESYCDMLIVPVFEYPDHDDHGSDAIVKSVIQDAEYCRKLDTNLGHPNGAIRIYVNSDLATNPAIMTKHGCELWFHPNEIYRLYGSTGVRIDWYPNKSFAFAVGDDHNDDVEASYQTMTETPDYYPGGWVQPFIDSNFGFVWMWETIITDSAGRCLGDDGQPLSTPLWNGSVLYQTPKPAFKAWAGDYWDHDNDSETPLKELTTDDMIYMCSYPSH